MPSLFSDAPRAFCCRQFIEQFFPTRTAPKEVHIITDKEIEDTIKFQLQVRLSAKPARALARLAKEGGIVKY